MEPGPTAVAFRRWAAHYNECGACGRDDWYDPGEGEPMFCHEGQRLFRAWVNLVASAFAPSTGSKVSYGK